jgi:acyl-coenzyme A thioesterase PaaI-like protein
MHVTNIPFAKHIGIEKKDEGTLKLEATKIVQNHIQSIHASAQFALAETQTGLYLQLAFPEFVGKVVGVLRGSTVKYKNPATISIYAVASIDKEMKEKFLSQFERKGRASIVVDVEVLDVENILTMQGKFSWYVQKLQSITL